MDLKILPVALLLSVALLAGCQPTHRTPEPLPQNQTPVVMDEAMMLRDWEPVTAWYENGTVVARPTGRGFEPDDDLEEWQYLLLEPPMFLGQTLIMPFYMIHARQWDERSYRGVTIEPTYHAQPPLE